MTDNPLPIRSDEDTEGHIRSWGADAESAEGGAEGQQDTEGHRFSRGADAESAESEDDVAGHVQPPRDVDR
ncbi:MAG: hypothetical protein ACR2JU_00185 [Nocardioidaceae bacterium]